MTEKEVETTYYEEKTQTETVVFCDACGIDCDERGGQKTLFVTNGSQPAQHIRHEALDRALRSKIQRRIEQSFTEDEPTETFQAKVVGGETFEAGESYDYLDFVTGKNAVEDACRSVDKGIKEVDYSRFSSIRHADRFDICDHCQSALGETEQNLETLLYEENDDEDEEGHTQFGGWEEGMAEMSTRGPSSWSPFPIFPIQSDSGWYAVFSGILAATVIAGAIVGGAEGAIAGLVVAALLWTYDLLKT